MAGNAQNKLGKLFVDIGVGGLGKTLKGLNSVSASFLLTKNAALQAVKPFVNVAKNAMNGAVGIGKMAAALGTTAINAQKLQYYLGTFNAKGLEGSVASIQQMFTLMHEGLGSIDGKAAYSMAQLGITDWWKYDGSYESTMQFIQDVKDALKNSNFTEAQKVMHLNNLNLGEWKYLFEKENFDLNKSLSIDDKTIQDLQKAEEAMNKFKNDFNQIQMKFMGKMLDGGLLDKLERLVDTSDKFLSGDKKSRTEVTNRLTGTGVVIGGAALGGPVGTAATGASVFGASQYSNNANSIGGHNYVPIGGGQLDFSVNPFKFNKTNKAKTANPAKLPDPLPPPPAETIKLPNNNVNIYTQINTTDPNTQYELLDIDPEPIQYEEAIQRNKAER